MPTTPQQFKVATTTMAHLVSSMAFDLAKARADLWSISEVLRADDPALFDKLLSLHGQETYQALNNAYKKNLSDLDQVLAAIQMAAFD